MSNKTTSCSTMRPMERAIRILAGTMITISLGLGYFVSPYWLLLTLFVGLNLFQSAFSHWCLAEQIFARLGVGDEKKSVPD
ncbi:DUF2892 domain-containing protein [Halalkalibaculum sp. DA384]|uniref:YgaP family membrane protein n=1 Tax=Halalkalibaculum sp. DA384 TaxID=3373606 RepID=UPI003754AC8F